MTRLCQLAEHYKSDKCPAIFSHQTLIVRIPEARVHPNADTLELIDILGYQLVSKKGNYKPGDLAVYIQPDSVVPQIEAFAWLWEGKAPEDVTERNRRITVRKFRKEFSEGLLMPLSDFPNMFYNGENTSLASLVKEGDDVSTLLGVTHWEGDKEQDTFGQSSKAPRVKRRPNSIRGWLRYFYYNTVRVLIVPWPCEVHFFEPTKVADDCVFVIKGENL